MTTPKALPHYLHMLRGINLANIDSTIEAARGADIAEERIVHAERARLRCVELFNSARNMATDSAEFQRAMDAGQSLFEIAQQLQDLIQLHPEVKRDRARQAGATKERGSRMPELDSWLDRKLRKGNASNDALWSELPTDSVAPVYRDGEQVYESSQSGRERNVGREGFDKRVTAARKRHSAIS